jgi:uncharacterized protein
VTAKAETAELREFVIDTDIHEVTRTTSDLLPFLAPEWHHFITEWGWHESRISTSAHHFSTPTPGRGMRLDSYPDDGGRPGSSLSLMQSQLLDGQGIEVGILNGMFHPSSMHSWLEFATALASAYNDWQIEKWLDPEPRLRGSVHIVTFDPELAVREIDRVGPHPKMVQVFLPVASDKLWGDPIYRDIFRAAARHGLAVTLHHNGQTRNAVGQSRYFLEHHTLLNQAHQGQIVSIVCSGILDELPDLKIVFLEGGFTWLPPLMWRFDQQLMEFRSEVPWLKRRPSDYLRDQFRFSTQPMEPLETRHFMQLIDMMGSEGMLMFSTDYPHFDFDSHARALPVGLPDGLRHRILFQNAADTFGISAPLSLSSSVAVAPTKSW